MSRTVTAEATYRHPPERVWHALTDRDALASWLMDNDLRPEVGATFTMTTEPAPGFDGVVHGEILEADPPHRLVYTWVGGAIDTVVAFTLTPTPDGGTHLHLEHSGFRGVRGQIISRILGGGWGKGLRREIPALLDGLAAGDHPRASGGS